jgi:hypothetical protein
LVRAAFKEASACSNLQADLLGAHWRPAEPHRALGQGGVELAGRLFVRALGAQQRGVAGDAVITRLDHLGLHQHQLAQGRELLLALRGLLAVVQPSVHRQERPRLGAQATVAAGGDTQSGEQQNSEPTVTSHAAGAYQSRRCIATDPPSIRALKYHCNLRDFVGFPM